jgi:uncharacterized protein
MRYAKYVVLGLVALVGLLLVWGVAVEPYLIDREEQVAPIPELPAAWEGRRVALIADLQVGMWLANTSTIRRIVEQLVRERPAAVLIAGDFVYRSLPDPSRELGTVIDVLRPLPEAGIPTYAVLGNHDYAVDPNKPDVKDERLAEQVRQALEGIGVVVLKNEAIPLPPPTAGDGATSGAAPGRPLHLVGIGAHLPGEDRPVDAVGRVPAGAPRLVLMHNPASFAPLPAGSAPLAMAGHTHGGQIRVPFTPSWSWMSLVEPGEIHAAGSIEGYGQPGNRLYVNRGIGFSVVPIRLFCPPELTVFTLRGSAG